MDYTERDIRFLKGIGEKRAILFNRLGIFTVGDLLHYYPRTYQDFSNPKPLMSTIIGDTCSIKATITEGCRVNYIRSGCTLYKFTAADDTAAVTITFFNNRFVKDMLKVGESYYFFGKIGGSGCRRDMTSPEFEKGNAALVMRPIYSLTQGLTSRQIAAAVKTALDGFEPDADPLPDEMRKKYSLCHFGYALLNIHFPKDRSALDTARRRLVFEELITLSLGMNLMRTKEGKNDAIKINKADFTQFYKKLGFTPTGAQIRAVNEASADMAKSKPMNRLLEGDVGSGKTAVAAALCWSAALAGCQSALMAPTEILAAQHYKTLSQLLASSQIKVELLTGSTKTAEKNRIKESLKNGETKVVVGTHALLSEGVDFLNLALVITDEQHRFGVAQRAALVSKGRDPHVLVMSATPIPRTLGLIIYGDLDISVLDEMPKGRRKIETFCVDSGKRTRVYNFIKKHIAEGHQGYIVCPLVEDSDAEGAESLAAATAYAENIAAKEFKGYRVGLLHGKLKPSEKDGVMKQFADGELQLLVATTVIEVGVDVANATIMVIENAERFGLSQLHQLRGRVGRSDTQSYCILISDSRKGTTGKRLATMCETTDGFKIAEKDLELRGPGDFFGSRQHGLPELRIADLFTDMDILKEAQSAATETLEADKALKDAENAGLRKLCENMFSKQGVVFN